MAQKIEKLIVFPVLVAVFFCNGCGIVGVLGTESQYDKKIPAEYNLTKQKKKILVLVEQPNWFNAEANLRYYLTEALHESLTAKVKIRPKYIIPYSELSEFRSNRSDFSSLSLAEMGKALKADVVLLVMVKDYQLNKLDESDYYNGLLEVQAALFETASGERLWPDTVEGKRVRVSLETGESGQEAAIERLANGCAYCITRYFYNCPKYKFKIFDEGVKAGWE